LNQYYAAEDSLRGDWLSGAKKGFAEYQDSATNVYSAMQNAASSALGGMSDMLTNLVTTGKHPSKALHLPSSKRLFKSLTSCWWPTPSRRPWGGLQVHSMAHRAAE
jgi:hypothetical protein